MRRSHTIAVIFPHVYGFLHAEILRGIDEVAAERGYHLLTAFAHGMRDQERLILNVLSETHVEALVVLNFDLSEAFFRGLDRRAVPLVVIDQPVRASGVASVTMDNEKGAGDAFLHLLGHCRERLAIIAGPAERYDSVRRMAGCRAAARKAGVAWQSLHIETGDFSRESGAKAMRRLLAAERPRGVLALNDQMALGAMLELKAADLRVPEDVAVVGFDDIETAQYIGLTTVRNPARDMGRAAGELAIGAGQPEHAFGDRVVPAGLVVRRTCGCGGTSPITVTPG
jgi:LacI family transcriptional regulator